MDNEIALGSELYDWLKRLPAQHFAAVAFYVDLLAAQRHRLHPSYARALDGKFRELRFHLDGRAVRITYCHGPGRQLLLLTVFVQARMRAEREIFRARSALRRHLREQGRPREQDRPREQRPREQDRPPEQSPREQDQPRESGLSEVRADA